MTRVRPLLVRLGLGVGALLVFLAVGEVATRIVGRAKGIDFTLYMRELSNSDRLPKSLQMWHPTLRWALSPGARVLATTSDFSVVYAVSSKGLRDREYPYDKPPDKIRIVALGDSLTFGEGISYGERFTDLAEDRFRNAEILTMGVPGYGLDQMLLMLAEEGIRYRPDVVLLVVAWTVASRHVLGDDWLDAAPIDDVAVRAAADTAPRQTIYRRAGDALLAPRQSALLRRSWFLSYLDYTITLWRLRPAMARSDRRAWGVRTINDTAVVPANDDTRKLDAYLRAGLRRLTPLARRHGFQIVIANIDPSWTPQIDVAALPPGTAVLDFGPELRAAAARRDLRFTYDPHFNPTTNRLLGRLLAAGLARLVRGLVE